MEVTILPSMCRICLKNDCCKLINFYHADEDEETPAFMLAKILGTNLEDENFMPEKIPKRICKSCDCELNLSYQFLEKALQAQAQLEHFLMMQKEKIDDDAYSKTGTNITELSENDNDEIMQSEEIVVYLNDDSSDEVTMNKNSPQADPNKFNEKCKNLEVKVHPTKTDKLVSIKKLSKRGRKPKADEKTKQMEDVKCHVCEICGNVFKKRGRLTEHLRRHATDAKYTCELCDERFILREGLRRHMFQHLGGKPFQCKFCSRTFFYESVKKAHEAIHGGHKPYICNKCGKAFAYSQALKKHQLIHDEIKLYTCTCCKKDFRLQHHLKQHEETKAHINAVQAAKQAVK